MLPPTVVTPLAGVWSEIGMSMNGRKSVLSLPLRECGLKYTAIAFSFIADCVTPLAGVWIEIYGRRLIDRFHHVTPLAGVWIRSEERNTPLPSQ